MSYNRFGSSYNPNGVDRKPYESADRFEERCREDAAEHDIREEQERRRDLCEFPDED